MKSVFDGYKPTRADNCGEVYFAGANTGVGFRTSYGEIASEECLERIYIIKGSAGCGKSTLMRKIAREAEGDGHSVICYLCGSDAHSLDCITLDGRIALLDGTPPHSVDMIFPRAKSELFDLSRFLDSASLERECEPIVRHTNAKREAYAAAYRYLAAAERVEDGIITLARTMFDSGKARAFAERFVRKLVTRKAGRGRVSHRYSHAVTMRGLSRAESARDGWQTYTVRDSMRCVPLLMEILSDRFAGAGCDVTLLHLPISNHVAGIEVQDAKISIVTHEAEDAVGVINTARFVKEEEKAEVRGEIRLAASVESSCMEAAVECLASASRHHFALEEIYSSAMDFSASDRVGDALWVDIRRRLV